jgi:hypothetical protein
MIASIFLHAVALALHLFALFFAIGIGMRHSEDDDKGVMVATFITLGAFGLAFVLQVIA